MNEEELIFGIKCSKCGKRCFLWGFFDYKCFKCWKKERRIKQLSKEIGGVGE